MPARFLVAATLLLTAAACLPGGSPDSRSKLVIPTKDDVAVVDGEPISLTTFLTLRAAMPSAPVEAVFNTAVSAAVLQRIHREQGKDLGYDIAVDLARYAYGETRDLARALAALGRDRVPPAGELKKALDEAVAHAVVQRNPRALAEIH
jgi:hypothetical protein